MLLLIYNKQELFSTHQNKRVVIIKGDKTSQTQILINDQLYFRMINRKKIRSKQVHITFCLEITILYLSNRCRVRWLLLPSSVLLELLRQYTFFLFYEFEFLFWDVRYLLRLLQESLFDCFLCDLFTFILSCYDRLQYPLCLFLQYLSKPLFEEHLQSIVPGLQLPISPYFSILDTISFFIFSHKLPGLSCFSSEYRR